MRHQPTLTCSNMKDIVILLVHLLTTVAKLLGPGGTKAVIAENFLLKQQLLVVTRSRRRAPNVQRPTDSSWVPGRFSSDRVAFSRSP